VGCGKKAEAQAGLGSQSKCGGYWELSEVVLLGMTGGIAGRKSRNSNGSSQTAQQGPYRSWQSLNTLSDLSAILGIPWQAHISAYAHLTMPPFKSWTCLSHFTKWDTEVTQTITMTSTPKYHMLED
jgi:hypothetical protein